MNRSMAKQRQTRLSKADTNKIVDKTISETLEEQADKALCKHYLLYLLSRLVTTTSESLAMIHEIGQYARTDKEKQEITRIIGIEKALSEWIQGILEEANKGLFR